MKPLSADAAAQAVNPDPFVITGPPGVGLRVGAMVLDRKPDGPIPPVRRRGQVLTARNYGTPAEDWLIAFSDDVSRVSITRPGDTGLLVVAARKAHEIVLDLTREEGRIPGALATGGGPHWRMVGVFRRPTTGKRRNLPITPYPKGSTLGARQSAVAWTCAVSGYFHRPTDGAIVHRSCDIVVPRLTGLDPADDTRLPDNSLAVNAEALSATLWHYYELGGGVL